MIVDVVAEVPEPQIQEQTVEVFKSIPQVRMSAHVVEQMVDVPLPHIMDEVEAARLISQECSQQSIVENVMDILVPQIHEQSVEVFQDDSAGAGVGTSRGADLASTTDPGTCCSSFQGDSAGAAGGTHGGRDRVERWKCGAQSRFDREEGTEQECQ